TVAQLHLAENRLDLAEESANRGIETLVTGDEDVLLAEVLSTKGRVLARLKRYRDAEKTFEWSYGVALRCGDREGAGRALLLMVEEMQKWITREALEDIGIRLQELLGETQKTAIRTRVQRALGLIRSIQPVT